MVAKVKTAVFFVVRLRLVVVVAMAVLTVAEGLFVVVFDNLTVVKLVFSDLIVNVEVAEMFAVLFIEVTPVTSAVVSNILEL